MSPGNGHPYSWSAICNGYDSRRLRETVYPQIADYLDKQKWPEARLVNAHVGFVWCQEKSLSSSVAQSTQIPRVCDSYEELVDLADAILLARDDVVERRPFVRAALASGKPIFIDKPVALNREEADQLLQRQAFPWQVFTCSALRYAPEMLLTQNERDVLGPLQEIKASTPKYWQTYAVHLLEPLIAQWGAGADYQFVQVSTSKRQCDLGLTINKIPVTVQCLGDGQAPIKIEYIGAHDRVSKIFSDAFRCFKTSLSEALIQWESQQLRIPREETLKIAEIIGWGAS